MENNEEEWKVNVSASFFVTFFREKKVEFGKHQKTVAHVCNASLSGALFLSFSLFRRIICSACYTVRPTLFGGRVLLSICFCLVYAFSFVVVKVLFFPYKRRAYVLCVYYHTQKLSSL